MASLRSRSLQRIALVFAVLVIGYAGIRFGRAMKERSETPVAEALPFPFKPGDRFPEVALADSLGNAVQSAALVTEHGAVVLLVETDCDGCIDMSIRWEQALADGFFDPSRVFAVSRASRDANNAFRAANHLSFPIYQDVEDAFVQKYKVLSYPLEVVVGQSGTIRSLSDDSESPVDGDAVRQAMTE